MEGSRGPPLLFAHRKGATLPGYRVSPFLSPTSPSTHHPSAALQRRSSDGDLSDTRVMEKCRKFEPLFRTSYESENAAGESGRIISDPLEPAASWESPDLAPQFSSRPTLTPLAAPASPRPQGRRSFNAFPRPWKARSRSPSPFRGKDLTGPSKNQTGESFHFRSISDSLKQINMSLGAKKDGKFKTGKSGDCTGKFTAITDSGGSFKSLVFSDKIGKLPLLSNESTGKFPLLSNNQVPDKFGSSPTLGNTEIIPNNADTSSVRPSSSSIFNKVSFFSSPTKDLQRDKTSNMYRSVATITISKIPKSPTSKSLPRSPHIETHTTHIEETTNQTTKEQFIKPSHNFSCSPQAISGNKEAVLRTQQVVEDEREKILPESTSKYNWCLRGMEESPPVSPCSPIPRNFPLLLPLATKYSSNGSELLSQPAELLGSQPRTCDEDNCVFRGVKSDLTFLNVSRNRVSRQNNPLYESLKSHEVVDSIKDSSLENSVESSAGGSGPGDREAPHLTGVNAQHCLMHTSGSRKLVRKKPEIPDKLSKRRSSEDGDQFTPQGKTLLTPSYSFSSGVHFYNLSKKNTSAHLPPTVQNTRHSKSILTPEEGSSGEDKNELPKNRTTTVSQILSTLNFARFRLEELTGALGGGKKEGGGKGPSSSGGGRGPPSRPSRARHDIEKLKKNTERLKESEHKSDSDRFLVKQTSEDVKPKVKTKAKSESSKSMFLAKQTLVRTNSSPASARPGEGSHLALQEPLIPFAHNPTPGSHEISKSPVQSPSTSPNLLLPPLPSSKQHRSNLQTRDIPFRSASVSQGELFCEKFSSSGKASPNLKLYPACKESWGGSHTLPRSTSQAQNPERGFAPLQGSELTVSLSSFDEVKSSQDSLKTKSKSEVNLSLADKDNLDVASNLSETPDVVLKSHLENTCKESQESSFFKPVLHIDMNNKNIENSNEKVHSSCEKSSQSTEGFKRYKKFSLNESLLRNFISDSNDNSDSPQKNQCVSGVHFETQFTRHLSSEELRSCKDICIQTDDPATIDPERSKKRGLRGSKTKSFEEKRAKFKLHIGVGKTLQEDTPVKTQDECLKFDKNITQETEDMHVPKQTYRKDSNVECRVVEKEPRRSQCLVIRSSSFNRSRDGEELRGGDEPSATSECRVVQTRPRLSLEDSEGESDKERRCQSLRNEFGEENKHQMESMMFSGSSDSSSQDSVGIHFNRNRIMQCASPIDENSQYVYHSQDNEFRRRIKDADDAAERSEGKRGKDNEDDLKTNKNNRKQEKMLMMLMMRKDADDAAERSEDKREKDNEDDLKANKNNRKQENLKRFNRHLTEDRIFRNDNSLSESESRPNSYSDQECLNLIMASSHASEKSEKKRKNRSDPGLKKSKNEDILNYFSDSNIESFKQEKERERKLDKRNQTIRSGPGVVSQTSTDSEGRDELGPYKGIQDVHRHSRSQTPRFSNPPVILSGHESDTSCHDISILTEYGNRNISRNASPSPYLGDSDSGERCIHRSPHGPRRYSKRPLRGPYGEMLEAEMSKSKSSSQFLTDDLFLRPRDSNSISPRPSSPASPSILPPTSSHDSFETSPPPIFVGVEDTPIPSLGVPRSSPPPLPHAIPASRSLDDSALRLYCSNIMTKSDNHLKPVSVTQFTTYESDSEGGGGGTGEVTGMLTASLRSGPLHQRTASSPSKLFFEPGSEEDQELLSYYSSSPKTPPSFPSIRDHKPTPHSLQHSQPILEGEGMTQARTQSGDEANMSSKPSKKQERHSKSPKSKKHSEEEPPRPHGTLPQVLKKGSLETEFRSLAEHRHTHRRHRDTRAHIIGEIYDTEKNYVDNLSFLLTRYEQPLRNSESSAIIEPTVVDDIFFQVPEIHDHHQRLLQELKQRLDSKDVNVCVGDVLLKMLKDPAVAESYKGFVNNWKTAQEAAKTTAQAKPAFRHFLVTMAKEHPGKLDLKALLITPVQRFPHYELILKRLLDHTCRDHPDNRLVQEAMTEVQKVAASINDIEQEALQQEQQQFILKEIENFIEGLVGLVQPDRTFLQLDSVTQNSGLGIRKERCLFLFSDILIITAIKRRSATIRKSASLQLALLSSLESCKLKLFKFISLDDLEIGRSRDDSIKKLVKELECLEEDLQTLTQICRLVRKLHFPKASLEEALQDMDASIRKQLGDRQGADSQLSELELNITTQEGIETLTFMFSNAEKRNKWEEGLNAAKQKLAMSADRRPPPEFMTALPIRKTRAGLQFTCAAHTLGLNAHNLKDVWVCNSDGYVGQVCVMSLQPEPTLACCNGVCNAKILSIASIPAAPRPDSSDEDDEEELSLEDDLRKRRSESLPPEIGSDENDSNQPTMWLGTEDGSIHVYNCSDTIRTKKNRFKFQPGSPVHCIIHIENRVFAALANGNVVVYERDNNGGWSCGERHVITLSTAAAPVTRMVVAGGKLWCSAASTVRILNINSLQVEHTIAVGGENGKGVACMVCSGQGVWIAMHYSAVVRLHHATTHECVCEVTITSPVTKMLAGCDDIIRQHKLACLKVTALLACKDLLWVGTSAGVIITLPLPHLSHNTRRVHTPPNMVGIPHGHTGNVRFLTSVEMTPESRSSRLKGHTRYSFKGKDPHHQPGTAAPSKLLVISGGDGYEDFRNSGLSELAGRDDSTNHLLLWQV